MGILGPPDTMRDDPHPICAGNNRNYANTNLNGPCLLESLKLSVK